MSSLLSPARGTRLPRTASSAVERARLALVPVRVSRAPRAPFAALVLAILGAGVVGLLMFNTHMQQGAFYATSLQNRADALTAREQSLQMQLDQLRDPQHLAVAGRQLGMVAPATPAFVDLATGKILGKPTPAGPADGIRVTPLPAGLPSPLRPKPIIVRVLAPTTAATTTQTGTHTPTGTGHASTNTGTTRGRNGAATPAHGAHR
ncbi:MAG: hypothetical protein JWQ32_372 [Marmoricola sp.]|nr:hypothetical protein [Marmoricola sp.]